MTINDDVFPQTTAGDGSTTTFTYSFKIFEDADLDVYQNSVLKTLNVDYTVTGAGNEAGGTIVFTIAPANGDTLIFTRSIKAERTADYQNAGDFIHTVVNKDFDKLMGLIQQLEESDGRKVGFPVTALTSGIDLPAPAPNLILAWNSTGTGFSNATAIGTWRGDWATSTAYIVLDVVKDAAGIGDLYICTEAHASGTLATDIAAGKWQKVIDLSTIRDFSENFSVSAYFVVPEADTYPVDYEANTTYTINQMWIECGTGTCTADIKINTTGVTGLTGIAVSGTQTNPQATANNTVSAGDDVTITFSSLSNCSKIKIKLGISI